MGATTIEVQFVIWSLGLRPSAKEHTCRHLSHQLNSFSDSYKPPSQGYQTIAPVIYFFQSTFTFSNFGDKIADFHKQNWTLIPPWFSDIWPNYPSILWIFAPKVVLLLKTEQNFPTSGKITKSILWILAPKISFWKLFSLWLSNYDWLKVATLNLSAKIWLFKIRRHF